MRKKTGSFLTVTFLLAMLFCVCSITAFGEDRGVEVIAGPGEQKSVTENTDITTNKADAVTVIANGEGSGASAVINGDVESDEGHGVVVSADKGKASAVINGDVEADEDGIDAKADNGGTVTVRVDGDVESDEDDGVDAQADNGSKISIVVDGDVKGEEEHGLDLTVSGSSAIDVAVTGKVEGDKAGIVTNACTPDCDGTVNVIAWKISVNKDGSGRPFVALDTNKAINSAFEKTIKYIIRIKDTDIISLPDLEKGEFGYTAFEGDEIRVRIDVPDGRELEHVYWDEDEELELIKGEDGFWYVRIPKGGGVVLSVDLDDDDDDDSGEGYRASSPNTGDREELAAWSAIMLAAMALLIGMIRKRTFNR